MVIAFSQVFGAAQSISRSADRILLAGASTPQLADVVDLGPVPASQRIAVTLTLAGETERTQALGTLLTELTEAGSPEYRHWLTPEQIRVRFGATPEQLAAAELWATDAGLVVDAVSPAGTRLRVSGSADQVERAFAVPINVFTAGGQRFFANAAQPSLPRTAASVISGVTGLDDLPSSFPAVLVTRGADGQPVRTPLDFAAIADRIDTNADSVLAFEFGPCAADLSPTMSAAWAPLAQQAAAQGITLLIADRGCAAKASLGGVAEATSVVTPGSVASVSGPTSRPRPTWQVAPGLPDDAFRRAPDLAATSLTALADTLKEIARAAGVRLGNVNPTLYQLAPLPGLFIQPDAAPAGTWEPATGLGQIDLATLAKAFPRGTSATQVTLKTSSPTQIHGSNVVLSAAVMAGTAGGPSPTGTLSFSTGTASLGGAPVFNSTGSLFTNRLNAGNYQITAIYSGDANYAGATSNAVSQVVLPEPALLSASAGPGVLVGGTITVKATVGSGSGVGTPTGTVTITQAGQTGTPVSYTGTLGGSGAVASTTISVPATTAGHLTFQAVCSGDVNFTCTTPVSFSVDVLRSANQASATVLTVSSATPTHGQNVTFRAVVSASSGSGVPTGSVSFASLANGPMGQAPVVNGTATLTTNQLFGGATSVTATYGGDSEFLDSLSPAVPVTVAPEPVQMTAALPPSAAFGTTIPITVNVSGASGIGMPTGVVTVQPQGSGYTGSVAGSLSGGTGSSSSVVLNLPATGAGTVTLAGTYAGDRNFAAAGPVSTTLVVARGSSRTALTLIPSQPGAGQAATLTAMVSALGAASPTGMVQFQDGTAVLRNVQLDPTGTAVLTVTLAAGSHALVAAYAGDTNYTPSTSQVISTGGGMVATTTALTASANTISVGQSVMMTSIVTPASLVANAPPSGTVQILDSGVAVGSGVLSGGAVTTSLTLAGVRTHTLTAVYAGDPSYTTSTSGPVSITVSGGPATLSATLNPATAIPAGSTATITATVTGSAGSFAPYEVITATIPGVVGGVYTGTVQGSTSSSSAAVAMSFPAPPAGTYQIQLSCSGNANTSCAPITLPLVTVAPGKIATTTTLGANPLSPAPGQAVMLTALVTPALLGSGAISGSVNFFDGATPLATAPVSNGTASASVTLTSSAVHSIVAVYTGDTLYTGSSSPAVTVGPPGSTNSPLLLSSNLTSGLVGLDVVLTAQTRATSGTGVMPTGTISFFAAASPVPRLLGTVPVSAAGVGLTLAVLTTNGLPGGVNTIYAAYSGDINFPPLVSENLVISLTDYGLTFNPPSLTLVRGTSGTVTILLGSINGFNGRVSFGCTPPPSTEITCSITPVLLNGNGTATLTVNTRAAGAAANAQSRPAPQPWFAGLSGTAALATLAFLLLPGSRGRRRVPGLLLVLLGLSLTAGVGCAANTSFGTPDAGTPLGTTNVVINTAGFDGVNTVRRNFNYQVTVQ